ncbi:MAG: putative transcriptional regulator, IclR family [Rhodospirillales bacterium]|nr:putative transcriptional regulator, IclR family [Rhodospirillales bacterium]
MNEANYSYSTLDRAVGILGVFDRKNPELSLTAVVERSGLHKVTVFRFLAALAHHGLIYKNPDSGLYSLGNALISLAEIAKVRPGVGSQALPVMRRIGQTLHENVALNLREGDFQRRVQTVEAAEGAVQAMLPLGLLAPLYVATAGRAMLAALSDTHLDEYLARTSLEQQTANTIADEALLREDIGKIRQRGYAETFKGPSSAAAGVAAVIRDGSNEPIATLSVTIPAYRYTPELRSSTIAAVISGADEISALMGYFQEMSSRIAP